MKDSNRLPRSCSPADLKPGSGKPQRRLAAIALAAAVMVPLTWTSFASAQAPAAPAAPAAVAPAVPAAPAAPAVTLPENETLKDSVENFWHYAKIARYDMAAAEAGRVLGQNTEPQELLAMFEAVTSVHQDNLDEWLLRWQGVEPMRDAATQLIATLGKGHQARRADPKYIEQNIQLAAANERGYALAINRLRDSGELAVPVLIDSLRDSKQSQYHPAVRRALVDLGLSAVNPLLAATASKDNATLMTVVNTLGDLGYDIAVPYLDRLLESPETPGSIKAVTTNALQRLRVADSSSLKATDLFYDLAERFYYDNAAVRADKRYPAGYVWYWDETKGLTKIDVPLPIFHDVMARRAAEYSLKLGTSHGDALSLWLAANYQSEADLLPGQKDPTIAGDAPSAHYYGVAAGTKYLNNALSRCNRDRNSAVAQKVISSLEEIGGQANLFGTGEHPLMDALHFPDRLVRYKAAFALAAALPSQHFAGEERVVPLLSEALSQTGTATVLVVLKDQNQLNTTLDALKGQGFNVVGGITPEQAVAAAASKPFVDAILMVEDDLGPTQINQLIGMAVQTPRLERAVRVILTKTKASTYSVQAVTDSMLYTTQAQLKDAPALKTAIDDARKRSGSLPLDEAAAAKYAGRAADLLARIAINHSPVFDLSVAQTNLLAALEDTRADVVKADANVLSLMPGEQIQPALLAKALDEKTPDDLKVVLFKAVAANARNFGDKIGDDQVKALQKVVDSGTNLDVRTAAGEARGALNLPADQAKLLIVNQSKT